MSDLDLGAPRSRNERILMNMLGDTYPIGVPQSRIEALLTQILEEGGGGGGQSKVFLATVNVTPASQIADAINARKVILVTYGADDATQAAVNAAIDGEKVILDTVEVGGSISDAYPTMTRHYVEEASWSLLDTSAARRNQLPLVATINVTTSSQITDAIDAGMPITVKESGTDKPMYAVIYASKLSDGKTHIITADIESDENFTGRLRPVFRSFDVLGAVWSALTPVKALVPPDIVNSVNSLPATGVVNTRYLLRVTDESTVGHHYDEYIYESGHWVFISKDRVFVATTGITTEAQIKDAMDDKKEIFITAGANQPLYPVASMENKGASGVYLTVNMITTDEERWNRKRPTAKGYTVLGNVWTVSDLIDAVIDEDFANIVTALPSEGVENTRYLLKVTDDSTEGYHLDEYIYDDDKWIYISKDKEAVFLATPSVTTASDLKDAINGNKVIMLKGSAPAQSSHVVTKAEILTGNSIKLTTCETGERPTIGTSIASFTVYTVDGTTNVWSASTTEGEIYIATIGVTTFAELSTAISSAKPIFVKDTPTGALMPAQRAEANATAAIVQVLITAIDPDTEETTCKVDRYTVTGSQWALSEISMAIADNYYTKSEIDLDITNIWQAFTDRRRVLHVLIRKNNDAGQFPMGWVAIVTANTQETYASFCTWLYSKNYRSPETSYGLTGGCCGTTGVRNSADTGTAYVGRITSGAYSTNGTSLCFKFDYNGTVTDIPEGRCAIISFPLS